MSQSLDMSTMLESMSSLGISPEIIQAAMRNPQHLKRLMDEVLSDTELSLDAPQTKEFDEEEITRVQAAVARERELGPIPPTGIIAPRYLFIQQMRHARKIYEDRVRELQGSSQAFMCRKAYVGTEKHFSETPLSKLARIALRDMLVRKVHRGKYLLCRVIVPSTKQVAIELAVEDPEGDARLLCLYNFPFMVNAGPEELDAIFPVGTVLVIREPHQKMSLQAENCFVRVDSPSDVTFVDPSSCTLEGITWMFGSHLRDAPRLPSTPYGWKDLGNMHFKASRWFCAAVAYTKGLSMEPTDPLLRANRAEAYLRLESYSSSLADCEKVLESPNNLDDVVRKVRFRAGKAEYGRGNFEAALFHFNILFSYGSDPTDAASWILRTTARIAESKSGNYDWLNLFIKSQASHHALDVADYTGPIEVRSLDNRGGGRGVMASRDIKAGELLLVAKPVAAVFPEDLPSKDEVIAVNLITKRMDYGCQVYVIRRIIERLYGNPELNDLVCHLYPGPRYPSPPASYPPPMTSSRTLENPLQCAMDLDIGKLESIVSNNAFGSQPLCYANFKHEKQTDHPSALYLLPSLFNHACAANTSREFFREVMVVRARTSIAQGEELTTPYTWNTTAFTRQESLDKWHFKCTCWLCEEDRAEGEEAFRKRDALIQSIKDIDESKHSAGFQVTKVSSVSSLQKVIKAISATFSRSHGQIRPDMVYLQHRLAHELQKRALKTPALYCDAIDVEVKAIEAAGIVVIDKSTTGRLKKSRSRLPIDGNTGPVVGGPITQDCVSQILMIVASFLSLDDLQRAERWLRAAWRVHEIMAGGGRELFEERFKNILQGGTRISTFSKTIQNI